MTTLPKISPPATPICSPDAQRAVTSWSVRELSASAYSLISYLPSALLITASAGFGASYAWNTGSTLGPVLGVLSVAMALGLELATPFAASRALIALKSFDFGTGMALGLLALVAVLFSLTSELSLMATSRGDIVAGRSAQGRKVIVAKSQLDAATQELAEMGHALGTATDVTVGEADAILTKLKSDTAWARTTGCTSITIGASKAYCGRVADAEAIRARAVHRGELKLAIKEAETVLASGAVETVADPSAEALATYLGALGFAVDATTVSRWSLLVGVLALEVGSSCAVILAGAMGGTGWRTEGETAHEAEPPKTTTIQAETPVAAREPGVAHEGLSERAKLVLVSLTGGSCSTDRRTWAKELGMSPTTLSRALADLETAGLAKVHADRNRGTSVRLLAA